jgi:hypothetical protein
MTQIGRELLFLPPVVSLKAATQSLGSVPEILDASDMDNRQTLAARGPKSHTGCVGAGN